VQPFLKWAGGKRWLRAEIGAIVPDWKGKYIEPFLGSGAVFFHLMPKQSILADLNSELISTYCAIRDRPDLVKRYLEEYSKLHSDDFYYQIRSKRPSSEYRAAAHFIYLNRTCWNGLYRVNKRGKFNVPRGTKNRIIFEEESFFSISEALRHSEIVCSDFELIIDKAMQGDLVYCDPPYTIHHEMNGFLKYNETIFSWSDQNRLKSAAIRASKRGAHVIISNASHSSLLELYSDTGNLTRSSRSSVISGNNKGRGAYNEILVEIAANERG
jgi:DNA adenine methylase